MYGHIGCPLSSCQIITIVCQDSPQKLIPVLELTEDTNLT